MRVKWLPLALWPLGAIAEGAAFYFLFRGEGEVPAVAVLFRAVGGSFIACGLIAWRRRPDNPTGALMALTGFLFFAEPLLAEADAWVAFTLAQVTANWWTVTFAVMILGFPNGTIGRVFDALIIGGFVLNQVVLQVIWLFFLEFPPGPSNVLLISADAGVADAIDTFQRWFGIIVVVGSLVVVSVVRWLRAPPILRRLLLPMLAGALAFFAITIQVDLRTGDGRAQPGVDARDPDRLRTRARRGPARVRMGAAAGAVRARPGWRTWWSPCATHRTPSNSGT